jgi:hypothetical protein
MSSQSVEPFLQLLQDVSKSLQQDSLLTHYPGLTIEFQELTNASIKEQQDPLPRRQIYRLLVKAVDQFNCLPPTVYLRGVRLHSEHPVDGGGYADIYKGIYQGKEVAIKKFRIFGPETGSGSLNKVHLACPHLIYAY